jgi:hypothetical protein
MKMRRSTFILVLGVVVAAGCDDKDPSEVSNPNTYQIVPPLANSVSVRQDLTINLRDSGLVIVRNGTDTVPGNNTTTQKSPRLSYFVENSDHVIVDPYGVLRGLKPGQTTVRAEGYDQEITFTVNVLPYTATLVRLTIASGPAGGLILPANQRDTGSFYAIPADRQSSILEGLILVGNDTVFCNRCGVKNPARVMRLVNFVSLNPALATVSNASDPFAQRASGTTLINTDTTGRVTALDTTSTPVGFVMESPTDGINDTVWVKFPLRPIDTLRLRPDSADFPPSDIDDIGTERRIYPNSDTTAGNFTQSGVVNFAVGADYLYRVVRLPVAPSTSNPSATTLSMNSTSSNPEIRRANLPIVAWESAQPSYLLIQADGINRAIVTGPCAFISTTCGASNSSSARTGQVITCADNEGQIPGTLFSGDGGYVVPSCSPTKTITPFPGALCTTASSTDLSSVCTIWVRGIITDQATGKIIRDNYRINVRR